MRRGAAREAARSVRWNKTRKVIMRREYRYGSEFGRIDLSVCLQWKSEFHLFGGPNG